MSVRAPARPLILALIAAMAIAILPASAARPVLAASPNVVISEVYGGGGNNTATFTHDFIELFNRGSSAVSLDGWSVQYASTAGTSWAKTNLTSVSLAAGQSYLVQQAQGAGGTTPLPTPDATGTIAMSATAGKVALVNNQVMIAAGTVCPTQPPVIDFVGYGPLTNCSETAPTAATANATSAARTNTCVDSDNNSAEFTVGAPTPQNTASALDPCEGDAAPSVASSSPGDGATDVAADATITVTFSESVTLAPDTIVLTCGGSVIPAPVGSGPVTTFELDYTPPLPDGASCVITVNDTGVSDTDGVPPTNMAADVSIDFTVIAADACAGTYTTIPAIQGSGANAAIQGSVTTEGVVISDDEGPVTTLRGFYLQDPAGDGNAATSDGIFVFNGTTNSVSNGDQVRVTGTSEEFQGQTQISNASIIVCGTGESVTPTDITFPVTSPTSLEAYEGMLIRVPEVLTVSEHFQLGRFGQVTLSSEGRLDNPTAVVAPGAPAVALQAANNLRKIILDDSLQSQNPDPIRFGREGNPLSAANTLRGGDTVTNLVGVMTYTWAGNGASPNAYRIRPLNALGGGDVDFQPTNPRPGSTVEIAGENVRVAGLNLLNYFNTFTGCTFGVGGLPADCRGANSQVEFDRQWPKTVAAIRGLEADVIGINEIENDGYGPTSAIVHLVERLNASTAPGTYAFIDVDAATGQVNAAGTDAIKVGLLYRPAAVTPVGATAALNSVAFVNGGDDFPRSRPSIAQAFETVDGARFIVDVNHFKSKGSACNAPDAGDGQGNCNVVRTNAAIALRDWLAADPTGTGDPDVLIVGDLNSYALEDPVTVLTDAGFTNLVDAFVGGTPYSYVFDAQWGYLDYALGSASAVAQVAGVVEWHINSDEPSVLDYNTDFKSDGQIISLYAPDRFRVSDHDPIIVGLDLTSDAPTVDAGGPYQVVEGGSVSLTATGADPTGDALTYAWDLDGNGSFETTGQTVTFSAAGLQAPGSRTVTVQVTDASGQTATDQATIEIVWSFKWRLPVQAPPRVNVWFAGLPFLAPFTLGGNQGNAVLDGPVTFQQTNCQSGAPIGTAQPIMNLGPLRYEPRTDSYWFIWLTTRSLAGKCGSLTVTLADGTDHEALFRFLR